MKTDENEIDENDLDTSSVSLFVRSETLNRNEVTELLGVEPTRAWNPGERHPISKDSTITRVVDWGQWQLKIYDNRSSVEFKIQKLFQQCTSNLEAWRTLRAKYEVWLTVGVYPDDWHSESTLSPETLLLLVERQLPLEWGTYYFGHGTFNTESEVP